MADKLLPLQKQKNKQTKQVRASCGNPYAGSRTALIVTTSAAG